MFITIHLDLNKLSNHWQTREYGYAEERKVDVSVNTFLCIFSHTNCALSANTHNNFSLLPSYARINKNICSVYHVSRVSVLSVTFVRSCTTMRMWTRFLSILEGNKIDETFLFSPHLLQDWTDHFLFFLLCLPPIPYKYIRIFHGFAVSFSLSRLFSVLLSFG